MPDYADRVEGLGTAGTPAGGVITVQGDVGGDPITISGEVSVEELPATQAAGDTITNPTTTNLMAMDMLWDGVNGEWVRARSVPNADNIARLGIPMVHVVGVDDTGVYDRLHGDTTKGLRIHHAVTLNTAIIAGGANAIATLTLPAAGAGLFHFITYLRIARVATAALAGAALLTVTSTNLSGIAWRTGNAMAAGGVVDLVHQSFASAWRSDVSNVATTIVGPAAGAAVSWDMECRYFTGPLG